MRIKTSTIIGFTIATILTTYIATLTFSNQAFGIDQRNQEMGYFPYGSLPVFHALAHSSTVADRYDNNEAQAGKVLAGHEAELGKTGLGDVCLSCFGH
jgi:hypothetical protein